MKNIRLDIAYDGTNYKGWQKQNHAPSIQEEIEKAIFKAFNQKINLTVAGRTDAGVHAYKQVANFKIDIDIPADKIYYWINANLSDDIKILKSEEVSDCFHARFSAKKKVYVYKIYNRNDLHPIYRNNYEVIYNKLDIDLMKEASKKFIGLKDFSSFSAALNPGTNTIRSINRIEFRDNFPILEIEFESESFLRNQIRIIAGTLVQIGRYRMDINKLDYIFESKDRTKAGPTLTGSGLYLVDIIY